MTLPALSFIAVRYSLSTESNLVSVTYVKVTLGP
jgi:hypothetical protein